MECHKYFFVKRLKSKIDRTIIIINIKIDILVDYYPNGSAYCTPPSLITTNCRLNIEDFPFDNKDCEFQFGR